MHHKPYFKLLSNPLLCFALLLFALSACNTRDDYRNVPNEVSGYVPVYVDSAEYIASIKSVLPRSIGTVGRTYLYRDYMFIVEQEAGIHVYDVSNASADPVPVCYLIVPQSNSLFIKDDILYIENALGLIYIDVSELPKINVLGVVSQPSSTQDIFAGIPESNNFFIRNSNNSQNNKTYIECPDASKGSIIKWERKIIQNPKCYIIK